MESHDRRRALGPNLGWSGHLKIAVIYDGGADDWSPEDIQSVLEPVEAVSESLSAYGHDVSRIPDRKSVV